MAVTSEEHRMCWKILDRKTKGVKFDSNIVVPGKTGTTGNRAFAECNFFCRVLKVGHSAKSYFAECRTRQRYTFAECQALGKARHSAKALFAKC